MGVEANGGTNTADESVSTLLTDTHDDAGGGAGNNGAGDGTNTEDPNKGGAGTGTEDGKEGAKPGADGNKPEDKGGDDSKPFEIKVPDGMTLDEQLLTSITPMLRAKNFTNEEAQQLADAYAASIAKSTTEFMETQRKAWSDQLSTWEKEVRADPEFGGEKFSVTIKTAQTVIARYGDDQLKKELKQFGIGNMPSLIRMLARAGKDMAEDGFHGGGAKGGAEDRPIEELLYPTMTKKS